MKRTFLLVMTTLSMACGGKVEGTEGTTSGRGPGAGGGSSGSGGSAVDLPFVEHFCDVAAASGCGSPDAPFDVHACKLEAPCALDTYSADGIRAFATCLGEKRCAGDPGACLDAESAKIAPTSSLVRFVDTCDKAWRRCGRLVGASFCPDTSGSSSFQINFLRDEVLDALDVCLDGADCSLIDVCTQNLIEKKFAVCH